MLIIIQNNTASKTMNNNSHLTTPDILTRDNIQNLVYTLLLN